MIGKKILLIAFISFAFLPSHAQDLQYSQFFAAPLHLNPAMAGATELTRVGLNYRKQWPGLDFDFHGYSAYLDHYSFDLKSGAGLSVNSFQESNMKIRYTDVSLFYSYNLLLKETSGLRFGGQFSLVQRDAVLDNLLMGDQINIFSNSISPVSLDNLPQFDPYKYLDLSFGLLYENEILWMGTSVHHINKPRLSFYQDKGENYLPIKYNVHSGVQTALQSGNYFNVAANYKRQGPFQQLDISGQILYSSMVMGLGYRGIPGTGELPNRDSIVLMAGLMTDGGFLFGYSFDYMISRLGTVTHGAHEVSLRYQFLAGNPKLRDQRSRILKCFNYLM